MASFWDNECTTIPHVEYIYHYTMCNFTFSLLTESIPNKIGTYLLKYKFKINWITHRLLLCNTIKVIIVYNAYSNTSSMFRSYNYYAITDISMH